MDGNRTPVRLGSTAAVAAAALWLASGCAKPPQAASPPPAVSPSTAAPGRVTVEVPGVDLRITGALLCLEPTGDDQLSMRVDNASSVPEHLDMIAAPDSGRAVLRGGSSDNGVMTSAGILIQPGAVVDFGADGGPRALLHRIHGVTSRGTVRLALQFGVAGLVHVDARVTGAA